MSLPFYWASIYGTAINATAPWTTTITQFGTYWDAVLYSRLLFPSTDLICDRVFLNLEQETNELYFSQRRSIFSRVGYGPAQEEEISNYNWVDLGHLFTMCNGSAEIIAAAQRDLANVLVETWSLTLRGKYPERLFTLGVLEPEVTGDELGVGFREQRR